MPRYFAAAPRGVEAVTAREIEALGAASVQTDFGGVHFDGDTALLYRANLILRTATRVLVPLRDFAASTPEMLYNQARRLPWNRYLDNTRTFAVDVKMAQRLTTHDSRPRTPGHARGTVHAAGKQATANPESRIPNPALSDHRPTTHDSRLTPGYPAHFAALKVKDAIADEMRKLTGARPDVDTKDPDVRVHAYVHGSRCTISLDSSGSSLHERGYRVKDTGAPLKEALAAALVELSGWDADSPFIDPMCGSGTIVIEAALKALRIPPGLRRKTFGFMRWPGFDHALWQETLAQARAGILEKTTQPILGYDTDPKSVEVSATNAKAAGVAHAVRFERREIADLRPAGDRPGVVIMNPPYGRRLVTHDSRLTTHDRRHTTPPSGAHTPHPVPGTADASLLPLYKSIGDTLKHHMKGWTAFVFTGNPNTVKQMGLRTSKRQILYNGPMECRLLRYDLY